jgi:hypothetical protein
MERGRAGMRSFMNDRITLFIPLSGRHEFWEEFSNFLNSIEYPKDQISLILMDTSHSNEFERMVKKWIGQSRFNDVRYIKKKVGKERLADERRVQNNLSVNMDLYFEIHNAMCSIYNTMKRVVSTKYVWVVEDDIIPPSDALHRLLTEMTPETVSVSGVYLHRYKEGHVVAWDYENTVLQSGSGVQRVKGNGFGCVLLRMNTVRQHVFTPDYVWPDFDRAFYHRLGEDEIVKLDWDVYCKHLSTIFTNEPCPHPYEGSVSRDDFNEEDYLRRYPDVWEELQKGILRSAYDHYESFGLKEGRIAIPESPFDEEYYLELYEDVRIAVKKGEYENGLHHYIESGRQQGRYSRVLRSTERKSEYSDEYFTNDHSTGTRMDTKENPLMKLNNF